MTGNKKCMLCSVLIFMFFLIVSCTEVYADFIIDNGNLGTSSTGYWTLSSDLTSYGGKSLWSRNGATYTWQFSSQPAGTYEVFMWWPTKSNGATSIAVDINTRDGNKRVYINQRLNGGKWNSLGKYAFNASGSVKITAATGSTIITSADAVKFVYTPADSLSPVAFIDSASPNPSQYKGIVAFSGHGTVSNGLITGYSWRSNIDGDLGSSASFSTSKLSAAIHSIFFKVKDDKERWSPEVGITIDVQEHLYVCPIYSPENILPRITSMLQQMGAVIGSQGWKYKNNKLNKTFMIHIVQDINTMKQALKTEGSHILISGHSNYGLGQVFATSTEIRNQTITDIRYIDDDRILNMSSPWVNISINGLRTSQAFPSWWPIFKDKSSGLMPYDFGDIMGNPPYNYYIAYQIPGDPLYYKLETAHNTALERFSDSGRPAWFSPDGLPPDPANPDHIQYFITNPAPWSASFEYNGDWIASKQVSGFYKEDYIYTPAGAGNDKALWIFTIPTAGYYNVNAWWPALQTGTSGAPFTISHALGETTVKVDQRINGNKWNKLGEFYFDVGDYSVLLTDAANSGNVVADAVKVSHIDNPPEIIQSNFWADTMTGPAPLEVNFTRDETGVITKWNWNFGDGSTNTTRDYVKHIYTTPGTYTVSLLVSGPLGSSTKTKTGYITVGSATPSLKAEFSASPRSSGIVPIHLAINFTDRSSGNIAAWNWDFGDGTIDTSQNPVHTYLIPGNYTVRLTVTNSAGFKHTETKENFIRAGIFEKAMDNVDYPKTHYRRKTIVFRKELEVPKEELKFDRMFYDGCNSGNYYLDTFNRGIVFYTVNTSDGRGISLYMKAYLEGKSNQEIWEILQAYSPTYDYYNFNKLPSEQ